MSHEVTESCQLFGMLLPRTRYEIKVFKKENTNWHSYYLTVRNLLIDAVLRWSLEIQMIPRTDKKKHLTYFYCDHVRQTINTFTC